MPAVTLILDMVEARLGNIRAERGYHTSPKKIDRARLKPFQGYDLPAINLWVTNLNVTSRQYRRDKRMVSLFVEMHDMTRDNPFTSVAEKMAADIVHGLNRDITAPLLSDPVSRDLGGKVTSFDFKGYDYEIGEGQAPWCGVLVRFEISYQSDNTDMENFDV